jgi:hypothetical protein
VPARHRRLRQISVLWLIPVFAAAATLGAYLALALATADLEGLGQWLRDFAKSPGAAAFAALIAAGIAFGGISKQVSVSRAALAQQAEVARSDAWWAMFEWASSRAIPPRHEDQPLPTTVTISTLERLADVATSNVQEAACAGVIDVLTQEIAPPIMKPSPDGAESSAADPDPAFAALTSYVESSRGTPAASAIAEALVYENEVSKALMAVSWQDPSIKIFRNPPSANDTGADAVAEVDGQRVIIEIKYPRSASRLRVMAHETIRRLRARGLDTDTYLLITPFPSPLGRDEESELRAVATQWRAPEDTGSLLAALRQASALA